jgi:phospholipase C
MSGQTGAPTEYLMAAWVVNPTPDSFTEMQHQLDGLAADGWELVTVNAGVAYFKRLAGGAPPA